MPHSAQGKTNLASHVSQPGLLPVRCHGGPWDGKDVYVEDPNLDTLRVQGPRHGQHSIWIVHYYDLCEGKFMYAQTETIPLSMSAYGKIAGTVSRRGEQG